MFGRQDCTYSAVYGAYIVHYMLRVLCRRLFCVLLQSMAMRRVHDLNTMCFSQCSLVQNVELHGNLI